MYRTVKSIFLQGHTLKSKNNKVYKKFKSMDRSMNKRCVKQSSLVLNHTWSTQWAQFRNLATPRAKTYWAVNGSTIWKTHLKTIRNCFVPNKQGSGIWDSTLVFCINRNWGNTETASKYTQKAQNIRFKIICDVDGWTAKAKKAQGTTYNHKGDENFYLA